MKTISKIFIILSISITAILYPTETLNGCAWISYPEDDFRFLVNENITANKAYQPFFLYYPAPLHPFNEEDNNEVEKNIKEWSDYLNVSVSSDHLKKLVYEYPEKDLQSLLDGKPEHVKDLPDDIKQIFANGNKDVLQYLIFVRRVQPYVKGISEWEGCAHDISSAKQYFNDADKIIAGSSDFIKYRMGYQLARLAHFTGDYDGILNYYNKYIGDNFAKSVTGYWALGHKAAALKQKGKLSEAIYNYSLVFAHSPEKRVKAFQSVNFDGPEFEDAFSLCKNNDEKVTLHFLNGLEHLMPETDNLKRIYSIKPDAEELEVLLIRELKKVEGMTVRDGFEYYYEGADRASKNSAVANLRDFASAGAQEGKVKNGGLWNFVAGYMSYMANDYDEAKKFLSAAKGSANEEISHEVKIVSAVIKIVEADSLSPELENDILHDIREIKAYKVKDEDPDNRHSDKAVKYIAEQLEKKYIEQGNKMQAVLCRNIYDRIDLYTKLNESVVDAFIAHLANREETQMSKFLEEYLKFKLPVLYEMKGTFSLRRGEYAKAVEWIEKSGVEKELTGDPFAFNINVCIDCITGPADEKYTKLSFAKKMVEYQKQAASGNNAAHYNFLLGLGAYNTTYFGRSWNGTDYFRSYYNGGDSKDPLYLPEYRDEGKPKDEMLMAYYEKLADGYLPKEGDDETPFYDCTLALSYFEKAMASKNKEEAAKACYMAAKCEESMRYVGMVDIPNGLGKHKYYKLLKDKYSNSNFYSEVIKECVYVKNYLDQPI